MLENMWKKGALTHCVNIAAATLKIQVENSQKSKNGIYYMTQMCHSLACALRIGHPTPQILDEPSPLSPNPQ